MKHKKGIKLNVESDSDISQLKKLSKKELGKNTNGNPDEWDYKNLKVLIDSYNKAYPGRLKKMAEDYRTEYRLSGRNEFGVVSKDSDMRFAMWMPADLQGVIEAAYPSFWVNKKHMAWFISKFPIFGASDKY